MTKRKNVRLRGKLKLSRYFQRLKKDDSVAIQREISVVSNFPKRLQGRTGIVTGRRGKSYIVKIKDHNFEKEHIINAIHLKKIKYLKKIK